MSADMMQINAKYLFDFIAPVIGFVVLISLLVKIAFPDEEVSGSDIIVNMLKMTAYGFLAGYIYLKVLYSSTTELDVLTFFTFILASLEATHCFINSFGEILAGLIRMFRLYKN